ncbi:hypothetical protein ACFYO2_34950 [Streptomyces sp. NPDC006602]|uniref:hypothetical protein n=1 Tax=Streptomyces sp. NPDC006602 TaxID=3364751 RepID=UPI0036BCA2F3
MTVTAADARATYQWRPHFQDVFPCPCVLPSSPAAGAALLLPVAPAALATPTSTDPYVTVTVDRRAVSRPTGPSPSGTYRCTGRSHPDGAAPVGRPAPLPGFHAAQRQDGTLIEG